VLEKEFGDLKKACNASLKRLKFLEKGEVGEL